ncbi:phosphoribosyltransferase [Limnohabitans sp. Hippo3]|uniref:phosphoribosyltransferase n=1 Tax=Limnohabitans sp. Hippo3 TaxID=1597956 RepID=UPI000D3C1095|nr:phosphoribosyltransferase family protein [Limnohabitans sp. Hippo3]PUE39548.1 phosphoribosyl transferase [Limnohabitans sp. Hippo3]
MFKDRLDAARQLSKALKKYEGQNPLILAIPRGAVPMGAWIADVLHGQMDVVLVRKLRTPSQPEVAIGAMDETGLAYLSPCAATLGIDPQYVKDEIKLQMKTLKARRQQYSQIRAPIPVQGRVVIVVDDGLATGATMMSALKAVRQHHPQRLVCAIPVASPDALARIKPLADETVYLHAPEDFMAVAQFYQQFPQVDDAQVLASLQTKFTA